MIKVSYSLNWLEVSGHANYANKGSDIVCAGVSAIVLGAINWFEPKEINVKADEDLLKVTLVKKTKANQKYLELIVKQLQPIGKKYKKYIQIRKG